MGSDERITTAQLAKKLGVEEGPLWEHLRQLGWIKPDGEQAWKLTGQGELKGGRYRYPGGPPIPVWPLDLEVDRIAKLPQTTQASSALENLKAGQTSKSKEVDPRVKAGQDFPDHCSTTQLAKRLGIKRDELFERLQAAGLAFRNENENNRWDLSAKGEERGGRYGGDRSSGRWWPIWPKSWTLADIKATASNQLEVKGSQADPPDLPEPPAWLDQEEPLPEPPEQLNASPRPEKPAGVSSKQPPEVSEVPLQQPAASAEPSPQEKLPSFGALELIDFWRRNLIDEMRCGTSEPAGEDTLLFETHQLATGQLPSQKLERMFLKEEERRQRFSKKGSPEKEARLTRLAMVINPIKIVKRVSHGKSSRTKPLYPLWLVAIVDREGRLHLPEQETAPWINRTLLSPNGQGELILGSLDTVDSYLTRHPLADQWDQMDWGKLYRYGTSLLDEVLNQSGLSDLGSVGYERIQEGRAFLYSDFDASFQIRRCYDFFLDHDLPEDVPEPVLLKRLGQPPGELQTFLSAPEIAAKSPLHTGQMRHANGLTLSQRESLTHLLHSDEPIMAVNGPPGTGKTTLLESLIATLWVEAALEQSEPPIIVASSTNNQAVTNVIDSFSKGSADSDPLAQRWLPEVESYGLFLAAESKVGEAAERGYQYCNPTGTKGSLDRFAAAYALKAKTEFLKKANQTLAAEFNSLEEVESRLNQELKTTLDEMRSGLELNTSLLKLLQKQDEHYAPQGGIEAALEAARQAEVHCEQLWKDCQDRAQQWAQTNQSIGALWHLFSWLPPVKKRLAAIYWQPFLTAHTEVLSPCEPEFKAVTERLGTIEQATQTSHQEAIHHRQEIENDLELRRQAQEAWDHWQERLGAQSVDPMQLNELDSTSGLLDWQDRVLRYKAFHLATHYWEARWLREALEQEKKPNAYREGREAHWRHWAKLFPCFVTTMYSGNRFFQAKHDDYSQVPMSQFIDLLIVDEAGQVNTAVAGGMLCLAKRAIVVGDSRQLEPITALPPAVDRGNALRSKMLDRPGQFEALQGEGLNSSKNLEGNQASLLGLAQARTPFRKTGKDQRSYHDQGLLLSEHWRCQPEVIQYCNDLAYEGWLRPMRPALEEHPWPALGYAHIKGQAKRQGTSRVNYREAEFLVNWIEQNRDDLNRCYPQAQGDLSKVLGIVTPFATQAGALKAQLRKIGLGQVTAGTVHSLQGAEMPIVLFSLVYDGSGQQGAFFFDRGVNMLNVAVSRAKDSFLVFGDMDLLDPRALSRPSGLLAHHLFAREENELGGIELPPHHEIQSAHARLDHLFETEHHREFLTRAFKEASQELGIISPFLRTRALNDDQIAQKIQACPAQVKIYYDPFLNQGNQQASAQAAHEMLAQAGAEVIPVRNVHSKTLWIDQRVISEGSFNWLSAVRSASPYRRRESTFVYQGGQVDNYIEKTKEYLAQAKIPQRR